MVEKSSDSDISQLLKPYTKDKRVIKFLEKHVHWLQPSEVVICDGSLAEKKRLEELLVFQGTLIPLNPGLRPGSFLARTHPSDVARVEDRTFICSNKEEDAGPTNHWASPPQMHNTLDTLFKGCMRGRPLYVMPFLMGPLGSEFSKSGIQLTDSPYVVLSTRIMTRMGVPTWNVIEQQEFVRAVHSVGKPVLGSEGDVPWPCNPEKLTIAHFPESREIYSFGSGYGGNALLGKKCFALRIATAMARDEGWLAEHMLISGVTTPEGKKHYIAASFPSACGKTNLAMLRPTLPGWKVECVGDDIAWLRVRDGRLHAINPEAGFFGVAPGTSAESNPHALATLHRDALFTNVALTSDGDVWWEGMTSNPPDHLTDWTGKPWVRGKSTAPAAHPNARFTVAAVQSPILDPCWEDPKGVPIEAVLFGGRRATRVPLVYEARDWRHGVFLGSIMASETTAAATGKVGQLRHDPYAMLPFCGYHMGDYFKHWLDFGEKYKHVKLPRFFNVNWFRKNEKGEWLWPGFGDNIRVLKWILGRRENDFRETIIGKVPTPESLDLSNLNIPKKNLDDLLTVQTGEWREEANEIEKYYKIFDDKLPAALWQELDKLKRAVN